MAPNCLLTILGFYVHAQYSLEIPPAFAVFTDQMTEGHVYELRSTEPSCTERRKGIHSHLSFCLHSRLGHTNKEISLYFCFWASEEDDHRPISFFVLSEHREFSDSVRTAKTSLFSWSGYSSATP